MPVLLLIMQDIKLDVKVICQLNDCNTFFGKASDISFIQLFRFSWVCLRIGSTINSWSLLVTQVLSYFFPITSTSAHHNVFLTADKLKIFSHVEIKGQIEVTRRRGRRRKKLLDDLKDRRGYCQLKEEALDRTMWRNRFWKRLWTCRLTDYWWWWWWWWYLPHNFF